MKKNRINKLMILAAVAFLSALYGGNTVSAAPKNEDGYIYCVASVSKVYVTAAVMRLADEGKVDLDAKITEYIPDFTMADERYQDITVRMLMNHTSGIMGSTQLGMFLYNDNDPIHYDSLLPVLSKQRLKADPGAYAAYCNDGFDLLERIVENVSGMSYTEYITENIVKPTGGTSTGTGANFCHNEDLVPAYSPNHIRYENGITMALGAGGVFSTAKDVANFGAAFFTGNTSLLSDTAKQEMATRWDQGRDEFADESGLGWDMVSHPKYEQANVKVLGKGGDAELNHAFLLVAPDEEISISVLSNGGSSTYNGIVAQALLDVALDERGIKVSDNVSPQYDSFTDVPKTFDEYAGMYSSADESGGAAVTVISFPDHKYMHTETISLAKTTITDYMYTNGKFAELAFPYEDGVKIDANPAVITFKQNNGHLYFAVEQTDIAPGLGENERKMYAGEKMEANPVSEEVLQSYRSISNQNFLLTNDVSSSVSYNKALARLYVNDAVPGYLFAYTNWGTRLLKIIDKEHAIAFQTIPSSANRDLIDITISSGKDGTYMNASSGLTYILNNAIMELTPSQKEIGLKTGEAMWFKIGEEMAEQPLLITHRPEKSSVYVYNKYGEVLYTSHDRDATDDLPMPEGGYIVFIGKTGDAITLR